jgi:hypothetical protein
MTTRKFLPARDLERILRENGLKPRGCRVYGDNYQVEFYAPKNATYGIVEARAKQTARIEGLEVVYSTLHRPAPASAESMLERGGFGPTDPRRNSDNWVELRVRLTPEFVDGCRPLIGLPTTGNPPNRNVGIGSKELRQVDSLWSAYSRLFEQAKACLPDEAFYTLLRDLYRLGSLYRHNWAQVSYACDIIEKALRKTEQVAL